MSMVVSVDDVVQIVKSIFTTMMDLEVSIYLGPWLAIDDRLTSSVFLEGEWNGAVSIECSRLQACQIAGKFLSMDPPPETVDDDVRDVLGELANMIGGNIKSVIAMDIRLSMPLVIVGNDYELRVCGSEIQEKVGFHFDGGNFWITIIRKDAPASSRSTMHDMAQQTV